MSEKIKEKPIDKDEQLTILELAAYYVKRYNLYIEPSREGYTPPQNGLSKYVMQLTRIMRKTSVGKKSLWDDIKSEDKKTVRQISINRFEDLCFGKWANYIGDLEHDEKTFEEDTEKYKLKTNKQYRLQKLAEKKAIKDEAIRNGVNNPEDDEIPVVPRNELEDKGYKMMIEALYSLFYEPFNWERLYMDLLDSKYDLDDGYNDDTPEEVDQARENIKDFHNYIGKRKKPEAPEKPLRKTTPKRLS